MFDFFFFFVSLAKIAFEANRKLQRAIKSKESRPATSLSLDLSTNPPPCGEHKSSSDLPKATKPPQTLTWQKPSGMLLPLLYPGRNGGPVGCQIPGRRWGGGQGAQVNLPFYSHQSLAAGGSRDLMHEVSGSPTSSPSPFNYRWAPGCAAFQETAPHAALGPRSAWLPFNWGDN